jgi:hypothetical protein
VFPKVELSVQALENAAIDARGESDQGPVTAGDADRCPNRTSFANHQDIDRPFLDTNFNARFRGSETTKRASHSAHTIQCGQSYSERHDQWPIPLDIERDNVCRNHISAVIVSLHIGKDGLSIWERGFEFARSR